MRRLGIVLCAFIVIGSGCSITFVRPTPQASAGAEPACASMAFPIADLAGAAVVVGLSSFVAGLANSANGYNGCDNDPRLCHHASASSGYVVAGALAASAVYGIIAGQSCRAQLEPAGAR